jgi:hypothetical protein
MPDTKVSGKWARERGLYVSSRDRIPAALTAKYEAENGT